MMSGPTIGDLTPDAVFRKERTATEEKVEAMYKFRYIAIPASALRGITVEELDELSSGPWAQHPPPPAVQEKMEGLYARILSDNSETILHESMHHEHLHRSVFWIYLNLCVTATRALLISSQIKPGLTERVGQAIVALKRDIFRIRAVIIPLEEHLHALEGVPGSRPDARFVGMKPDGIRAFYMRVPHLIDALRCGPDEINYREGGTRVLPMGHLGMLARVGTVFLSRHGMSISLAGWPTVFRALKGPVRSSFTSVVASNAFRRYPKITEMPTVRTFHRGNQITFDPGAQFAGQRMVSKSVEAHLLGAELTEPVGDRFLWVNYLLEKQAAKEVFGRLLFEHSTYEFLSKWLFGTPALGDSLERFDRTVAERAQLERHRSLAREWAQVREGVLIRGATRFPNLNEAMIRNYLNGYYFHGV